MAKLGVITDGISTNFEHALKIMSENDLNQAELQYLWDKEVGDFDKSEIDKIEAALPVIGKTASCFIVFLLAVGASCRMLLTRFRCG